MTTLYSGGLVFDGNGNLLENHGVLVDGERISKIAPIGEFEGYSGEKTDTSGGTLLPGLIDCHVHLVYCGEADPKTSLLKLGPGQIVMKAFENAQKTLRSGVTSIRDLGGRDYLEFAVRDACNSGRQLGPTIMAAGRMICMTGGHGNAFGRIADGPDEVLKAVREQIHAGSDVIKLMATGGVMTPGVNPEDAHYTEEEMRVGVNEGHRFHRTCASHAQGAAGILNAVRAGMDSIEHGIFMTQECLEAMLERGTYLVPTLAAVNNIYLNRDNGIPAFIVEKTIRVRERHHQSIKMFYDAGGKIAMGTDAGTPFNTHGDNSQELKYMTEIGISNSDALKFSTANAADLMGIADRGQIEEGFYADLLIVSGNPVDDISAVTNQYNHRSVVKNGELVIN
ncbi:MAG: amidohydrolase family protein [SAR324 cluster bacterium]|nr:amidohydrolase family protein [SAR324 cluster bacterium]MBL7035121.1 amidohydrolase family protein [SAR324 cluster bacterium]